MFKTLQTVSKKEHNQGMALPRRAKFRTAESPPCWSEHTSTAGGWGLSLGAVPKRTGEAWYRKLNGPKGT